MQEFTREPILPASTSESAEQEQSERDSLLSKKHLLPDADKDGVPEHELKFAISEIPKEIKDGIRRGDYRYDVMTQRYMNLPHKNPKKEGRRIRSREIWNPTEGLRYTIEHKKKCKVVGADGVETKDPISSLEAGGETKDLNSFSQVWGASSEIVLHKVRFHIPPGVELDIYLGPLQGLVTAEIEFDSKAGAVNFQNEHAKGGLKKPVGWLGEDLTGKSQFGSSKLAERKMLPEGAVRCDVSNLDIEKIVEIRKGVHGALDKNYPDFRNAA